ncbi:MAG: amidohydrolase [Candidatus Hodarchaeota archaeon]
MKSASPDRILHNAKVITINSEQEFAEMIAIKNGLITYVGKEDSRLLDRCSDCWDLEGRAVVPGFIDLHTHLWAEADKIFFDLGSATKLSQALNLLTHEVSSRPAGEWIFAKNWDESNWTDEQRFLNRKDLDAISEDHCIYASREDGHLVAVNSAAFAALNIPPSHTGLDKDAAGNPTGILKDVWVDVTPYFKDRLPDNILAGCKIALSKGITSVVDNLKITAEGQSDIIRAYMALDRQNKVPIRIFLNFRYSFIQNFAQLGILNHWGSSKLHVSGFKGFYDGAIGAQTALLMEKYVDHETKGDRFADPKELVKEIELAEKNNYTVCIHAIGDQAIEELLDCYETALKNVGKQKTENRHRIEHAEMISADQIKRATRLGIWLSMQPNFLKWQQPDGLYEKRLGKTRFLHLNPFRLILNIGGFLAFGSDNMPLGPLYGIGQAATFPSEEVQISVEEAIHCYSLNPAKALFMDHKIGSIETNKSADLVILSRSPLDVKPESMYKIDVEFTLVDGLTVYSQERDH